VGGLLIWLIAVFLPEHSQLVISSLDMPGLTPHPAVRFLPEAVCTSGCVPKADVENVPF
jgi:hypothetical protein